MNRNYKVIIKNVILHKNSFLVSANSHLDAFRQIVQYLPTNINKEFKSLRLLETGRAVHAHISYRIRKPRRGTEIFFSNHDSVRVVIVKLKDIDNEKKI